MFDFYNCSQGLFAKIIGVSPQFVGGMLAGYGVVLKNFNGSIALLPSLRRYFSDYAWSFGTAGRLQAIDAAAARVYRIKPPKSRLQNDALHCCRAFLPKFKIAEFKFVVLKCLLQLGGENPNYFTDAESDLHNLREQFRNAQEKLKRKILATKIKPVLAETFLLARYVDCEKFADIAFDFSYSVSHVRRLHRIAVAQFLKSAI